MELWTGLMMSMDCLASPEFTDLHKLNYNTLLHIYTWSKNTKYSYIVFSFHCIESRSLPGGESEAVSPAHTALLNQCIKKIKDTGMRLSGDHKELHGLVSKVGKAIDKVH